MLKVRVDVPAFAMGMCKYTFQLFADHHSIEYYWADNNEELFDVFISNHDRAHIRISDKWLYHFEHRSFDHNKLFEDEAVIKDSGGKPDYFSTCFYMVNCLQEWYKTDDNLDKLGRFKFEHSYQSKYKCIEANLVSTYFDNILDQLPQIKSPKRLVKSKIHLSHDVDFLTSGFRMDGLHAIKKGHLVHFASLLWKKLAGRSHWDNIEEVVHIHQRSGTSSCFFFMVNHKPTTLPGSSRTFDNADYDITLPKYKRIFDFLERHHWEFGLHKSLATSSFSDELSLLPRPTSINRNHYLRFSLPEHFQLLDDAGITDDFSLGFSEVMGLRNNYGLPFQPFNLKKDQAHEVVIHPLQIMDTTFWAHQLQSADQTYDLIKAYLFRNQYNCEIGVLWHNNIFTSLALANYADVYARLFLIQNE